MKLLVCGGAGYIGSNMTALLAAHGHRPVVFDNFSKGHRAAVADATVVEGDLGEYKLLVQTLGRYDIEAVMHFAAFIEAGESVKFPLSFYRNNFCNTENLLRAMAETGVEKLVFSSTAAVYGVPQRIPVTEDQLAEPINPYGDSKRAVERMCHFQAQTGKLRLAVLRYFNACGAGSDGTLGEDHHPESHLIPLAIQAAMGRRDDVKIFGTDYPTPDGTCIRDYIHIEDLCRAHLLALDKLESQPEMTYNLGNGTGYSVRQVIDTVRRVSGRRFKITEVPRRPGDSPILTADSTKARTELGWQPQRPALEDMVASAWKWHTGHPKGHED
jgi:UDP-glucose 4-epimerase